MKLDFEVMRHENLLTRLRERIEILEERLRVEQDEDSLEKLILNMSYSEFLTSQPRPDQIRRVNDWIDRAFKLKEKMKAEARGEKQSIAT